MYKDLIGGNVCERKRVEDGEGGERHQTVMLVVNPVKEADKEILDFSAVLRKDIKALRDGPAIYLLCAPYLIGQQPMESLILAQM